MFVKKIKKKEEKMKTDALDIAYYSSWREKYREGEEILTPW